jgi:hypothetical protein
MIRTATGFGCGCREASIDGRDYAAGPPSGFGGLFSTLLNVAGATVGDPALGSQIASQAGPAFANITETPAQIAQHVLPDVKTRLATNTPPTAAQISSQAQQIGAAIAPQVAAALAQDGVRLPAGTVGADMQHPNYLDAFGGGNAKWVLVGGLALSALLLFKEL